MAVTATPYLPVLDHLADADIDWVADTIHLALLTSAYTPDTDTHDTFADVDTNEVSGAGYTAGGEPLANKTRTTNTGTNTTTLDADDVTFDPDSGTPRYGVIYKKRGGAASADELIGLVDFGENVPTSGGLEILWNAAGILTLNIP